MSPVERSSGHASRAVLVSSLGIVVVAVVLWGASLLYSRSSTSEHGLGADVFDAGRTSRQAAEIAENGPILYSDVSGEGSRDIILQHLGESEKTGWYAFLAQPDGKPRDCAWQWRDSEGRFRASCDRSLTLPPSGEGAKRFPVRVRDGRVLVDLNADTRPTTTAP